MWRYWWYTDPKGPDPWRAWYDKQDAQVRGKHDTVFRILESRSDWREPHTKKLDDVILEIILKGRVQHRLLGFYWPDQRFEFVFVLSCTHKGSVYKPKNALETASERRKELINGSTWMKSCVRPR